MFKVEYLIYIYMALCACMMIFNIVYTIYNKTTEKSVEKQKSRFMKKMKSQISTIENYKEITAKQRKYLYNKLKRVHNLMLFEQIIDGMKDEIIKEEYLENIQYVFHDLAIYYQKADGIKKAYFAYIVGKYKISKDIEKNVLINTLFMFLDEESMYCRDNSLKAIIKFGNIDNIIRALKKIEQSEYYYSTEIIFENLLEFEENKKILAEEMWKEFQQFSENIQIAIIKFIDCRRVNYSKEFYKLLEKEDIDNKIKVEIIKYFKHNVFEEAEPLLIYNAKLIGVLNRELVIESAKALKKYNSPEVKETLKLLLKRNDWDIKMAASESLSILGTSYYELAEIYNGDDDIAREILRYKVQSHKYRYTKLEKEVS